MKKYLTIDDLLAFCKQSKLDSFSAKDAGGPIIIQSFGNVEISDTTTMGLTSCTLQACHTELNKNHSFIEESVMQNALASFANRPILGYVYQLNDGSWDFWDHRMSIEEDGDETRVEYLERPIGVVPESCNAHLEYDEDKQRKYVVVNGYIYDDYGNRAIDIIKEKGGQIDVSVELAINSMSYNAKENYLNIEDFTFMGVTCLGKTPDGTVVQPGMEGSNLKLDNFSAKQNSMFSDDYQAKMIELLDKLNTTLSNFNNNFEEKGGNNMTKFEELLTQYGKTAEDITFETAGLSDEEVEAKFKEAFESGEPEELKNDEGAAKTDEPIGTEEKMGSEGDKSFVLSYELSHDDIRYALYELLDAYSENGYCTCWIIEVYDNKFIYQDYAENKYYKCGYSKDGDTVSLMDNKVEVFNEWLSKEEKDALDALKENYTALEAKYSELKTFKDNYDAAELKAKKDAIFSRDEYSVLGDDEAFKLLVSDAEKFSVEEVEAKAKAIFADYVIKTGTFSAKDDGKQKPKVIGFNFNAKDNGKSKKPYGTLFDNK